MDRALGHSKGETIGSGIDEAHIRVRSDAQEGLAHLNFGAAIGVGNEPVAGAQRQIGRGLAPVVVAHGLNGHGAGNIGDPASLGGRIILGD